MMYFRKLIFVLAIVLFASSCTKQIDTTKPYKVSSNASWVQELKQRNPLKDSANITSVYFCYDTIVNDYKVSGIFYPIYQEEYKNDRWGGWSYESGVYMIFHNVQTGKEFVFSKMGKWISGDDYCEYFLSKNIMDIFSNSFNGFGKEDAYIFKYHDEEVCCENPLLLEADFQFADVDFDEEDELVICNHGGGQRGCNSFDLYDITADGLVLKESQNEVTWFAFDEYTKFDTINRCIIWHASESSCQWGEYIYQADKNGNLRCVRHLSYFYDEANNRQMVDTTYYN